MLHIMSRHFCRLVLSSHVTRILLAQGALTVVSKDPANVKRVESQLKQASDEMLHMLS